MRKIIHVDMDCFYAAIEMRDNPDYRGKPIAVGGRPGGRGVVTTASYEARKYGVRSAMPSSMAQKLCPDLIFVRSRFDVYRKTGLEIREIFKRYTDKIEPLSLDEAYLDVTDCRDSGGSATLIAQKIRRDIFEELGLMASAGVAPNKFLAKVASDWKKPNGIFVIRSEDVSEFVKTLKIEKINGVGKVTARKMHNMGIFTCLDLQRLNQEELTKKFGKWGRRLYKICRGVDHRQVSVSRERKSLSVESTFGRDRNSKDECHDSLEEIIPEFFERLEKFLDKKFSEKAPDSVLNSAVVKVKFSDFQVMTREKKIGIQFGKGNASSGIKLIIGERTQSLYETLPILFHQLLDSVFESRNDSVRLLGVGVKFSNENHQDLSKGGREVEEIEGFAGENRFDQGRQLSLI